ncbi:hypothetical protein Tco_1416718 [Tanacetum coccineum]
MTSSSNRCGKAKTTQPWTTVETYVVPGATHGNLRDIRHHEKVVAFSVVYDSVQRIDENGSSDLVLFQNALAEFQTGCGHPFTVEACWRILKNHAAWTEIEMPTYQ